MKQLKWMAATIVAGLLATTTLSAHGRVDAGPIYVHLDVLENGKTVEKLDMEGFRADGYFQVYSGLIFKPSFSIAGGRGEYYSGTLGLGFYLPMGDLIPCLDGLSFLPQAGWTGGRLSSKINSGSIHGIDRIFRSTTGFAGLEGTYQLLRNVSISGSILYGWSSTRTTANKEPFGQLIAKNQQYSSSKGFSYSAMVDYQFTEHWSVNLAGVYNLMLSKENHGMRALGTRLGLGYRW